MLEPGTQIAYVPMHAEGDLEHPDVEFGFVTSMQGEDAAWCRYWRKGYPGQLRTVSNSEGTPLSNIVVLEEPLVSQHIIIDWFQEEAERIKAHV